MIVAGGGQGTANIKEINVESGIQVSRPILRSRLMPPTCPLPDNNPLEWGGRNRPVFAGNSRLADRGGGGGLPCLWGSAGPSVAKRQGDKDRLPLRPGDAAGSGDSISMVQICDAGRLCPRTRLVVELLTTYSSASMPPIAI